MLYSFYIYYKSILNKKVFGARSLSSFLIYLFFNLKKSINYNINQQIKLKYFNIYMLVYTIVNTEETHQNEHNI